MWLRTILIALLIFFVLRAVMRLIRGIQQGAAVGGAARRGGAPPPVKMVADPVCGTFVVPGKALQAVRGGETQYFCSEDCRTQWIAAR